MSFVRTLVLIAIAAGLGAWLWFVEAPKIQQEIKKNQLVDFDPASVEKLRLAYPDETEIVLARDGDKWNLVAPLAAPADKSVVENFLNTVKDTKIERRLTKEETGSLASYGLEGERGAQARLEITAEGKPLPAVVLGIATPVGYQAFARREGEDEVFVIPLLLQSSAKKTTLELRKKTLFEGSDSTGIKHVTIEKPGEKIELERKSETEWAMLSPRADAADFESVRSMLDSIATIDAVGFYDGDQVDRKAFGLEQGATRFTATREDGSTIRFVIGKEAPDQPAGNYFERASDGQVAKVPDWAATKFSPPSAELREKRLLACNATEIRRLTWTFAGDSFTLAREAAGKPWTISPEVAGEVLNQRIIDNALSGLILARADEVAGDAESDAELESFGLHAPLARLDVATDKGPCAALAAAPAPAPAEAEGAQRPATYFVKDASRSAVLRISQHEYSRLAMKRPEFVESAAKPAAE